MRIPLFRNSTVSISKDETVQESRTFLIGDSGARNAGKRPDQRRDGCLDAPHDYRGLTGCRTVSRRHRARTAPPAISTPASAVMLVCRLGALPACMRAMIRHTTTERR